jgi:hypothetical protein
MGANAQHEISLSSMPSTQGHPLTLNHLNIQPEANNSTDDKIAHIMKEQFGLKLKELTGTY